MHQRQPAKPTIDDAILELTRLVDEIEVLTPRVVDMPSAASRLDTIRRRTATLIRVVLTAALDHEHRLRREAVALERFEQLDRSA